MTFTMLPLLATLPLGLVSARRYTKLRVTHPSWLGDSVEHGGLCCKGLARHDPGYPVQPEHCLTRFALDSVLRSPSDFYVPFRDAMKERDLQGQCLWMIAKSKFQIDDCATVGSYTDAIINREPNSGTAEIASEALWKLLGRCLHLETSGDMARATEAVLATATKDVLKYLAAVLAKSTKTVHSEGDGSKRVASQSLLAMEKIFEASDEEPCYGCSYVAPLLDIVKESLMSASMSGTTSLNGVIQILQSLSSRYLLHPERTIVEEILDTMRIYLEFLKESIVEGTEKSQAALEAVEKQIFEMEPLVKDVEQWWLRLTMNKREKELRYRLSFTPGGGAPVDLPLELLSTEHADGYSTDSSDMSMD